MSAGVLQRLAEWEKHSPELLRRVGCELELRSRVFRGEKSAPLAEDIDRFADRAIPELDRLIRMQRDHFGSRTGASSCQDVAEWMKQQVQGRASEFPSLGGNIAQLCGWVETLPKRNPDAGRAVRRGTMRPSTFFHAWYADCSQRSLKDVKNQVSRRRSRR
jgi:hypothetical protein